MACNNVQPLILLKNISKTFAHHDKKLSALENINLSISSGEFIAITGASGSGKTTLLSIIGCLDTPDTGEYLWNEQVLAYDNEEVLSRLRKYHVGFVFQLFNLIPRLTALQNVELPMMYAAVPKAERQKRAALALQAVGLGNRLLYTPGQLSGGQQQRVAIARALVNNPQLIIADEPTGALDENNAQEIMHLFSELNRGGKTIVYVTHDKHIAAYAHRILQIEQGKIRRDVKVQ